MPPRYRSRPWDARRSAWGTHLYIAAIALALAVSAPGAAQAPVRELLNSERIEAAFGSYGIEVLEQDQGVRVSALFSDEAEGRTCRTFAIVRYAPRIDPAARAEHAAVVAGGSLGAVFAAQGWEVRKTHLSYATRPASPRLASLMRIDAGTPLAEHIYVLDVAKEGRVIEYAALVEIHHPDYLDRDALETIYGPVDAARQELVEQLREIATERTR